MTLTCQESSWLYDCLAIQFLIIWPSRCSFEVRILSPFYRWRNRGLRRWKNLVKVILQVSGRDRPPVQDTRVQIHLTAKAYNYFWLAVLVLALVVPSAGWMTSNRPLSFGGFMSEIPAGSTCVLYACPWTIKMRGSTPSAGSREKKLWLCLPWETLPDCPRLSYYHSSYSHNTHSLAL